MRARTFTTRDDALLAYHEGGTGPDTVLLVHGWSMSARCWHEQFAALTARYRVIAPDLRGHGASAAVTHGPRIARLAADVAELLAACQATQVHAIGWSMGMSVLLSYVDLFTGHALRSLTLVDQSPKLLNENGWTRGVFSLTRPALEEQDRMVRHDRTRFIQAFVPAMFHLPPQPRELQEIIGDCSACDAAFAADLLLDHCSQDWLDLLPRITSPTLVLAGRFSPNVAGAEEAARRIDAAEYHCFENSSHCPFLEQPADFNQRLLSFLARH